MAISLPYESDHEEEDEFIDMEVGFCTSNSFTHSVPCHQNHNQNSREFEFQMSSTPIEPGPTTSPADELFYNGKLLPLCPLPRLQLIEKVLHFSNMTSHNAKCIQTPESSEELYSTPLITNTTPTPFESCNATPSESCRASRELNPEEHLFDYPNAISGLGDSNLNMNSDFIGDHQCQKKSWTRKIKLIKQSSLSSKLKASRAYFKSLFGKSDNSKLPEEGSEDIKAPKGLMSSKPEKPLKVEDKSSSLVSGSCSKKVDNLSGCHRRSFSVSIKRHSSNKISSSLSSKNTCKKLDGLDVVQLLKRSSSVNSGSDSPIQGAIAHCKRSHQHSFSSRKTLCETGFHSFAASRLSISEDQEKLTSLCRG